jgi:hypothetical protein
MVVQKQVRVTVPLPAKTHRVAKRFASRRVTLGAVVEEALDFFRKQRQAEERRNAIFAKYQKLFTVDA